MAPNDRITLTPVYRFEWSDGTVRTTNDDDVLTDDANWSPQAAEMLAKLGRADPNCEVTLVGMGS